MVLHIAKKKWPRRPMSAWQTWVSLDYRVKAAHLLMIALGAVLLVAEHHLFGSLTKVEKVQRPFLPTLPSVTDNYKPYVYTTEVMPEKKHSDTVAVCVAVRAYPKQSSALTTMLLSVREAATRVPLGKMSLYVHIVDTEGGHHAPDDFIRESIDVAQMVHDREDSGHDVFFFHSLQKFNRTCEKDYGYQATQRIVNFFLHDRGCDWILTTNGDNLFGPLFFQNVGVVDEKSASIIGVEFVTHHLRNTSNGLNRCCQTVPTRMEEAWVDLSSVLITRKILSACPSAKFYPNCKKVRFAQDWKVFAALINNCKATSRIVPEVHLFHN
jgi:hypothetical protein